MRSLCLGFLLILVGSVQGQTPLARAHAHNDYEHARPLWDALDQGFCSVEADVWPVSGDLLVGHYLADTRPLKNLETLYLAPLQERFRTNGGKIFAGAPEFTLLIDIKSDPEATYAVLKPLLIRYRTMLTRFTPTNQTRGGVTVILTGERPIDKVAAESERWWAIDGRLPDLVSNPSPFLVPLISDNWRPTFPWFVEGELAPEARARLRRYAEQAHQQQRRIRFWGVQDQPAVWRVLDEAGVDLINTDHLVELRAYFATRPSPP